MMSKQNENPEEILKNFIIYLQSEKPLVDEAKKYITKTQQEISKYVGEGNIEYNISSLHLLFKRFADFKLSQKVSTNPCKAEVKIKYSFELHGKMVKKEAQMTLIKEKECRKPDKDGVWGVNVHSFKLIK